MDEASGYCIGCGRTIEEITHWGATPLDQRVETMAQLPERLQDKPPLPTDSR
jgi:predicted Fe-S protein YdhL (DUF1289 family)